MGKSHPIELRERVVAFVDEGHTHSAAAAHFRVSPRFVNDMIILRRQTGKLVPKTQGHGGKVGKLREHHTWVCRRLQENGELTLDALVVEFAARGVSVHLQNLMVPKRCSTLSCRRSAQGEHRVVSQGHPLAALFLQKMHKPPRLKQIVYVR